MKITDHRAHVISAPICNESDPVTARNFTDQPVMDPRQALQKRPEIPCNRATETASISSGAPEDPPSERGTLDIESSSTSLSFFDDRCPSMTGTERIAAALAASEYHRPTRCPRCSSVEVCPMFDRDMIQWLCTDCGRPFVERD